MGKGTKQDDKKNLAILFLSVFIGLLIILGTWEGDDAPDLVDEGNNLSKKFNEYWLQGLAEISRFSLQQARYDEIHNGDAVLIYVTEDFLTDIHVKSEHSARAQNTTSVIKLNLIKKFITGVYPYSVMSSIFTPINREQFPQTLKISASSQEWCGHTYLQLNLRKLLYQGSRHSYFMKEADQKISAGPGLLEDEIWNTIRMNPADLPVGDIELIPGSQFCLLNHITPGIAQAEAQLIEEGDKFKYVIKYRNLARKLNIIFNRAFPYDIMEWEETRTNKDQDNSTLKTRAVRTDILLLDYWNKNHVSDSVYRSKLGL